MGNATRSKSQCSWFAALALLAFSLNALAQSSYIGPDGGSWSVDANWSPAGVPGAGASVTFQNSSAIDRTLNYDYGGEALTLGTLTIDQTSATGNINTFSMPGNALSAYTEYLGKAGRGVFDQTGGTHTVLGVLELGINVYAPGHLPAVGTYSMNGTATLIAARVAVGFGGTGVFNLNGGNATIENLSLGTGDIQFRSTGIGTFSQTNGALRVGVEQVDGDNTIFNQINGDHTASVLLIGVRNNGVFNLSDGTLTVNGDSPNYLGFGESIGYFGSTGVFNQTGGTHIVKANSLLIGFGQVASGTYNLSGGSLTTPITQIADGGTALFKQTGGSHTTGSLILGTSPSAHASYLLSDGVLNAAQSTNNGAISQSGGTASLGPVDGTGTLTVTGGTLAAIHLRQAAISLDGTGQIAITPGGGNAGVSRVGSFSLAPAATTAKLDLANNPLIVDYTTTSPLSSIRSALRSAFVGGPGITSAAAATDPAHALSYAEGAEVLDLSGANTATWNGQTVDATTVLVSYALAGDSNLDGKVDFADLVKVAQNYGKSDGTADWFQGDFNYDGNVGFADLVTLAQHYGTGTPAAANFQGDLAAAFANVPEPSIPVGLLSLCLSWFIRPRRPRAGFAKI